MKKLFAAFLLFPLFTLAQIEKKIDSLQKAIASTLPDSSKVQAYDRLLAYYVDRDPDQAQAEINRMENGKNSQSIPEAVFLYYKGQIAYQKDDYAKAHAYFGEAAEKALYAKNYKLYQRSSARKVQILLLMRKFDTAEQELNAYLKKSKTLKDNSGLYEIYFLYGILNYDRGYLNTAIKNYQKADAVFSARFGEESVERVGFLDNIAQTYRQLKNHDKAVAYTDRALSIARQAKDSGAIMNIILHKGIIETDFRNYRKALPMLDKSYLYFSKVNNSEFRGSGALYLGIAYLGLEAYKNAEYFLNQAKGTYEQNGDAQRLAETMGYLGSVYTGMGNFKAARYCLDAAQRLMPSKSDSPAYVEIVAHEVHYFEKMGDYKNALRLLRQKNSLQDAIDKKTNQANRNEIEARFQTARKEKKIQTLSAENQLTQRQKMAQLYIFLSVLLLLIIAGFMIYTAYQNRVRMAEKMREISEMKSKFFANISHEFRTPLTLIKSPLQTLKASAGDYYQNKQLELIEKNVDRMLELVNQLLELSKIDGGGLQLIFKQAPLDAFLETLVEPFAYLAQTQNTAFISNIEKTGPQFFDKDALAKITSNLLSNAFRHNEENQPIYFSATTEKKQLHLRISNTTSALKKEDVSRLFERFYHKNDNGNSSGIGLALVKELIDLYGGSIETKLKKGQLHFLVKLPLDQQNSHAVQIESPETPMPPMETQLVREAKDLPILLIVEDNPEIRGVIRQVFAGDYSLFEAENGEQALQIAKREIPDCIISDIMMPKMDGLAFTYAIKNNELTSFIPLVLLTANPSEDTHLAALQKTADAFLTKPFDHDILQATVAQLIAARRKFQQRYSRELVLKPMGISINPVDEKFIDRLQAVVRNELANAEFSTDDFATALGMSRMQLHRKLKTLLGVSATEFFRNERLNAAAELLRKGGANLSEIAFSVGFNDLSYFSQCFRQRFGLTPSQFAEKGTTTAK